MTPDVDRSALGLFVYRGVFDGTNGTEIAVRIADELLFADVDEEPLNVEPGDDVVVHVVRMNDHGWFKMVLLTRT
jgi:hypothetical protein